jgi:hypothetical protein
MKLSHLIRKIGKVMERSAIKKIEYYLNFQVKCNDDNESLIVV